MPDPPGHQSDTSSESLRSLALKEPIVYQVVLHNDLLQQARRTLSARPRPFLRWAGSKRRLMPHVVPLLPNKFRIYREPFLGSGSLFFLLRPDHANLSDSCRELVETFEALRHDPAGIISYLEVLQPSPLLFYEIRAQRSTDRTERAAEFIYLNKTCWNGLYRVNAQGVFNVPYGWPKGKTIMNSDNLRDCALALAKPGVQIACADFECALGDTKADDLVFIDPPYITGHSNNGFVDYNEVLFSWDDQKRLAVLARDLVDRGAHVIVANAHNESVLSLYTGFCVKPVDRTSTIAGDSSKRRSVQEVLIYKNQQDRARIFSVGGSSG